MSEERFCPYIDFALQAIGEAGREILLSVQGTSMLPLMMQGDRVSIRPMPAGMIEVGDVFAFRENGKVIVHRCVGKKTRDGSMRFCQKGDNLEGWSWVREEQVIGKVERIVKPGKVLQLSTRPWSRAGRVMGFLVCVWISVAEKSRSSIGAASRSRIAPLLSALSRTTAYTINGLWSFSVKWLHG